MTEEKDTRRNACMSCSTSPQISELKPVLPASNTPTTAHSRAAKPMVRPNSAPSNRAATPWPTAISARPGRGSRPASMRTCGRMASEAAEIPRIVTLELEPEPRLRRLISTTTSRAASGRPSGPVAISGWVSATPASARPTTLWTSEAADLRITTTLSGDPESTRVRSSPSASIRMAVKANTTSAMPPAVSAVVRRRARRLRRL